MDLKKRSEIHWARKIWHMGGVAVLAAIYAFLPERTALILLGLAWLGFVPVDIIRQRSQYVNDILLHAFKALLRQNEEKHLAGTTYLLTGVLFVAAIFPREVVILTLLFLAFADPIASYFGIRFGKDKIIGQKSLQGSLAAFVVCAVLSFVFLYTHNLMIEHIVLISLVGGLIGALAELIPIFRLDDNLTLPVVSAVSLWIVFTLFGVIS